MAGINRSKLALAGALLTGVILTLWSSSASANVGIYVGGPAEIGRYSGPIYPYSPGYLHPYPNFRYAALRWYDNGVWPKNPDPEAYRTSGYQSYYFPNDAYYIVPKGKHHCKGGCR
jgi:hypothetical protein